MVRLTALYPAGPDTQFDHDYYEGKHRELVRDRLTPLGLIKIEMERNLAGFGGGPASYVACGQLYFPSLGDLEAGFGAHGAELIGDIANFSNVQPVVHIGTVS